MLARPWRLHLLKADLGSLPVCELDLYDCIASLRSRVQGRSAFELPVWSNGTGPERIHSREPRDEGTGEPSGVNSFEQSYNPRGHPQNPESRALVHRNVRAHNEVLATVDVCARVDSEGRDVAKPRKNGRAASERRQNVAILQENETGLWLGVIDDLACLITTTFTANMRQRIEASGSD